MGFKDLFFVSEETPDNQQEQTKAPDKTIKFPEPSKTTSDFSFNNKSETQSSFTPSPSFNSPLSGEPTQEQINKAFELYEKGFESLNQAGYDFFEYFKAITAGGVENSQLYPMAFAMGHSMDSSISKDKLLSQSEFYLSEISKVYEDFNSKGNLKKEDVLRQKTNENLSLVNEVSSIQEQINALNIQLNDRQTKLSAIDSKYAITLKDVEGKIQANTLAKDKIVNTIQAVRTGIINNLK